jgi:hypothetical protein
MVRFAQPAAASDFVPVAAQPLAVRHEARVVHLHAKDGNNLRGPSTSLAQRHNHLSP